MDESCNDCVISFNLAASSSNVDWSDDNIDGANVKSGAVDQQIANFRTGVVDRCLQQNCKFDITASGS